MRFGFKAAATLTATALLSTITLTAHADASTNDNVNVTVDPGTLSVALAPLTTFSTTLPTMDAAQLTQDMTITVTDSTGSGAGWTVYSSVSAVNYTGSYAGTLRPEAFSVSTMKSVREDVLPGDPTDPANLPDAAFGLAGGDLGLGQTLLEAMPNAGKGQFTAVFDLNVAVPAKTDPGTYTGILATTIVSGNI